MSQMTMTVAEPPLRQRADYTHSHNREMGRHGWLRLTPAYSVKVVAELLEGVPVGRTLLDPFCGTGTTALLGASLGHRSYTTEINPFLVWYATAKLAIYDERDRSEAQRLIDRALAHVYRDGHDLAAPPPIFNIERWWEGKELRFLLGIKRTFADFGAEPQRCKAEDLVKIAFCRTLIALSNAAFNHQSMSFKEAKHPALPFSDRVDLYAGAFLDAGSTVLKAAAVNPAACGTVVQGDAREVDRLVTEQIDLVITSPPYPNRMSYIRELRPYMYWLDFLTDAKDAAALDWEAIGGTWGSATSRLKSWVPPRDGYASCLLDGVVESIGRPVNMNGQLLGQYVKKYFHDTYAHIAGLKNVLTANASVHYVVGNSMFYGTLLPVEELYAEIIETAGFTDVAIRSLRKRNSKKELVEYCVSARWPG